jgi:PAS domain-containing protein
LRGRFAFCGTFPGVAPAGCWPAPYSRGARTFLCIRRCSGRPAAWRNADGRRQAGQSSATPRFTFRQPLLHYAWRMHDNPAEPPIRPFTSIADLNRRLQEDRERFVAFAFAGADLLLETTMDGRIQFAAGAVRTYFDHEPSVLLGRPATSLIDADDHAGFTACLELLGARGRMGPTLLRLSNRRRSPCMLSGLARPGPDGTALFCLSFGPRATAASATPAGGCSPAAFRRQAEQRLRTASRDPAAPLTTLDLLEISGAGQADSADTITATFLDRLGGGPLPAILGQGDLRLFAAPRQERQRQTSPRSSPGWKTPCAPIGSMPGSWERSS